MADQRMRKLADTDLMEAVTAEHERLKSDLAEWAISNGYPDVLAGLPSGRRPDVLRYDPGTRQLFVGDAKNAGVETTRNPLTVRRIAGYVREFARLLDGPKVEGGVIAVATNDADEAEEWVLALNLFCVMSRLTDHGGNGADFQVLKLPDKDTWITWW